MKAATLSLASSMVCAMWGADEDVHVSNLLSTDAEGVVEDLVVMWFRASEGFRSRAAAACHLVVRDDGSAAYGDDRLEVLQSLSHRESQGGARYLTPGAVLLVLD